MNALPSIPRELTAERLVSLLMLLGTPGYTASRLARTYDLTPCRVREIRSDWQAYIDTFSAIPDASRAIRWRDRMVQRVANAQWRTHR